MLALAAYGFVTEDEILSALRRDGSSLGGEPEAIGRAANRALADMEAYTGRRLACRTYRDAVTVAACTLTANSTAVTVASGFTAGAKAGDAVLGAHLQPGATVASVTSDTALILSLPAAAASSGGGDTLTFGSERLLFDMDGGSHEIWIPETPVKEVYSAAWLDGAGLENDFDISGAQLDKQTGRYYLPNDAVPAGILNLLVGCRAGYVRPTATDRGDPDFYSLQGIQFRLTQVFFDDERRNPGRALSRQLISIGSTIPGFLLPDDIKQSLAPFVRRG